jgi:predicted DNA-binding protein
MARPRKGEEKRATAAVGARISEELRAGLDRVAKMNRRPLADEVRVAIEKHVARELRAAEKAKG